MTTNRQMSSRNRNQTLTRSVPPSEKIAVVVFDLDGTLTDVKDIWLYLHDELGVSSPKENLEAEYLAGRISYEEWARADASRWRGMAVSMVKRAIDRVQFVPGAREAIQTLRHNGIQVGVVSAGIDLLANRAKHELGLDFAEANKLCTSSGSLTGEVLVRVETLLKTKAIEQQLQKHGHKLEKSATVGDNPQDLHPQAGLRVAFGKWDRNITEIADVSIRGHDFDSLLRILLPNSLRAV